MSSMRLFNKEYLFQNIKKSLGPLCVTVCIMPILNFILLLFLAISGKNGYILDLRTLSMFNYASIFILPLVLSICLFGFIFKKKSVDFINSMPISRSSVFITNTIGGILIIIAMMLINVILTSIISILFSNVIIPFNLIIDYFIFWTISYIFIFTVSNISVSLSGNAITSIVVTLLILFLIPFCHSYITQKNNIPNKTYIKCEDNSCIPNDYICGGNNSCTIKAQDNIYYLNNSISEIVYNYTMPYLLINSIITGNDDIIYFNITIFLKMFVLSIIYIFIGLYVFSKRKMENCETSFKNIHAHLTIKCLTLVPIVAFLYEVISIDNDLSTLIIIMFVLVLVLTYYFIYDLITKHGIKSIKLSCIYFLISVLVIYGLCGLNECITNKNKSPYIINSSNIKNITISLGTDINISNKKIINKILSYSLNNSNDKDKTNYMNVKYLMGKKIIEKHIFMSDNELDSLIKELNNDSESNKKILNELKSKKYAYQIDNKYYKFDSKLDKILNSSLNDIDLKDYYKKINENTCKIIIYSYENSNSKTTYMPCDLSSELNKYISDKKQEELYRILREEDSIHISLNAGFESKIYDDFSYVYDMVFEDLLQFMKNNKLEDYDSSKDGCMLSLYYSGEQYEYYTNNVDEIVKIIESKIELVKDTEDYKKYIDNLNTNEYDKKKDDRYE